MIETGLHRERPKSSGNLVIDEILAGLQRPQKELPSKLFYDERGSILFDRICELEEYYPTRTELSIMNENIDEMTAEIGAGALLIELGSGSSVKTTLLLDHLKSPSGYIPVDISKAHLEKSAKRLRKDYPGITIEPLAADYTRPLDLPEWGMPLERRVIYFPGSTIGNFTPSQARGFLKRMAHIAGKNGGLLIGADLKKDPAILHAAYNDKKGVTAEFNLNILRHVNTVAAANFDLSLWSHKAFYNQADGRIEMHLVSREPQRVSVAGDQIIFRRNETILTEYSYKYAVAEFANLVSDSFEVRRVWTDSNAYFSVQWLTVL